MIKQVINCKNPRKLVLIFILSEFLLEKWARLFRQGSENFKWNALGYYAADLIAGSFAKYASSGV